VASRYYVSTALPTALSSSLGASGNPEVTSLPGDWPASYPFCVLIDWGTPAQEAILVTSAPTGSGPYALPCTRGIDNTTAQSHDAGAVAVHGTTGYEPTQIQALLSDVATLAIEVPVPPGGTTEYYRADGTWDVPPGSGITLAGDLGGSDASPEVLSTHLSAGLPVNQGGTGAQTAPASTAYAAKAATTEAIYYVSTASYASDSNDGLSWGSAFASFQHAVGALPSHGGRIYAGAGTITTSSPLSLNGLTNVVIEAAGGRTGGSAAGTLLIYSGTAAAFITAQSSVGCQLRGLQIAYTNSGFTGNLVDARNVSSTDTAFFRLDNCLLAGSSISTAGALVALDKCNTSEIVNCDFTNAAVGITGRSSGGYSNGIRIAGNQFANLGTCGIVSSGQAWVIEANTFEPLASGAAGAYSYGAGQAGNGVTFSGNWFGDVTDGGTWITWNGNNLVVAGNYIAGDTSTTAVAVTSNDNSGIDIRSNDFDILSKAVDLGSTTGQTNFAVMFNTYTSVTTPVNATTWPTGGILYDGSVLRVGNFAMTGAASGSGAGVYFDAETSGDSAASFRGGTGLHVTSSAGTEKFQLDAAVTFQHAANSIVTTTSLPALIPGVILASNTITLTLQAPSNGYRSFIKNINTSAGNVTLSPSTGTIDGASSLVLSPLESVEIVGDGNNWWVVAQVATTVL